MNPILAELGAAAGATADSIKKWPGRGIPPKWQLRILDLAEERGLSIGRADLRFKKRKAAKPAPKRRRAA